MNTLRAAVAALEAAGYSASWGFDGRVASSAARGESDEGFWFRVNDETRRAAHGLALEKAALAWCAELGVPVRPRAGIGANTPDEAPVEFTADRLREMRQTADELRRLQEGRPFGVGEGPPG